MGNYNELNNNKKYKVLFVCLGNICRSPAAEAIAKKLVDEHTSWNIDIDSAGLLSYHEGEPADQRMIQAAKRRGYDITSFSRPIQIADFFNFDLIVAMDDSNAHRLYEIAPDLESSRKIVKMADFFLDSRCIDHVPDPYYGGNEGFSVVLDLLEESIPSLLQYASN